MRLVEAWVTLSLALLLCGIAWRVAALHTAVEQRMRDRALDQEALSSVAGVLDWELGGGSASIDPEGAIQLRAFRGWGRVCAGGWAWVGVAWQGLRRPDPRRDSLLIFAADGGVRLRALTAVATRSTLEGCGPLSADEQGLRIEWAEPEHEPAGAAGLWMLVRAFEHGSYVPGPALRYRRGQGPRQPVTAERFTRADVQRAGDGSIEFDLETGSGRARLTW